MGWRKYQSGFGTVEILLVVLVVAVLAVTGEVIYQRHKPSSTKNSEVTSSSYMTPQPKSTATSQTQQTVARYLTINEWGVRLPLSAKIADAYYVIPSGISNDEDGRPSGIYLSVASLKNSCGDISVGNTDISVGKAVGEIVRSLPTDQDPVSGKLYTQLNPNGTTIGGYYYGYTGTISDKTCASKNLLQSIDSAFADAAKGIGATTH